MLELHEAVARCHERAENVRNHDALVRLVVLHDAAHCARDGTQSGIQHMWMLLHVVRRSAAVAPTVAAVDGAGLVVGAVGRTHKLTELATGREPRLEVELACSGVVERAGHNVDDLVRQSERIVELLGRGDHLVVHLPRRVVARGAHDELLDLVELMDAENAERVTAVRASLLAEARRVACIAHGRLELLLADPLVAVVRADGLLGRRDEVLVVPLTSDLVELLVELRELRHGGHGLLIEEEGRVEGLVAALHEEGHGVLDKGQLKKHKVALEHKGTTSGHLCDTVAAVHHAEHLHEIHVVVLAALRHVTDRAHDAVFVLIAIDGNGLVHNVANRVEHLVAAGLVVRRVFRLLWDPRGLDVLGEEVELADGERVHRLLLQRTGLCCGQNVLGDVGERNLLGRCGASRGLHLDAGGLAAGISALAEIFERVLRLAPLLVEVNDAVDGSGVSVAATLGLADQVRVATTLSAEEVDVKNHLERRERKYFNKVQKL
eukprot:PhM_4_TR6337/c0_g1_i2/m.52490